MLPICFISVSFCISSPIFYHIPRPFSRGKRCHLRQAKLPLTHFRLCPLSCRHFRIPSPVFGTQRRGGKFRRAAIVSPFFNPKTFLLLHKCRQISIKIVFRHLFLRHPLRMVNDEFQIRSDLLQKIAVIFDVIHRSLSRPVKFL